MLTFSRIFGSEVDTRQSSAIFWKHSAAVPGWLHMSMKVDRVVEDSTHIWSMMSTAAFVSSCSQSTWQSIGFNTNTCSSLHMDCWTVSTYSWIKLWQQAEFIMASVLQLAAHPEGKARPIGGYRSSALWCMAITTPYLMRLPSQANSTTTALSWHTFPIPLRIGG